MSYVEAVVGEDGMVHVAVPDRAPGTKVRIGVSREEQIRRAAENYQKRIGAFEGQIVIHDSFDEPIEGLP